MILLISSIQHLARPIVNPLIHPKYRADIDGLRAVAVLSVLGFHAFPEFMPGGFIGVDVFFVISGFLISSIIFSNLENASFSIMEFYNRRIRRIFPSLITVMVGSLILGWLMMLAGEYRQLGKHVLGGVTFTSNLLLWGESGYFDESAELKVLLHLWSLAIEEQFYIFWPLLLAFVWSRKWSFLSITAIVASGSFVTNIYLIGSDQTASFYSPLARFWELMMGGILAYVKLHRPYLICRHRDAQSVTGFVLLVTGLILIRKDLGFPGWWALLPTTGTLLLLASGSTSLVNRNLLANRIATWFGLISYPLYLWHWPILSIAKIREGTLSLEIRGLLVLLSILLAWGTCRYIESPIRFSKHKKTSVGLLAALVMVGFVGFCCYANNGYNGYGFRDKEKVEFSNYFENGRPEWKYFNRESIFEKYREKCNFYNIKMFLAGSATQTPLDSIDRECYQKRSNAKYSVLLWGDSHAAQLYFGLQRNLPATWQVLQVTTSGCIPSIQQEKVIFDNACEKSNYFALETVRAQHPDVVVVAQNVGHVSSSMAHIGTRLESQGVNTVIFTGPSPHWSRDLPKVIMRKLWIGTPSRTFSEIDTDVLKTDARVRESFIPSSSLHFVSLIDYFCDQKGCLTRIGDDKKSGITTWDYGHLTPIASDAFARDVLVPLIISRNGKD